MKRAAKTKSGPKPKAAPVRRPGTLEPTLDGVAKRINAQFTACTIEAAVALERLADVCQKWVLEQDLHRERGRLIRQREELEYGSKAYDRVQVKINEIAARKVEWDAAWMPLMLLERRLRELAAAQLKLTKTPSAKDCWDVVAPIAALLNEHLKGMPAELTLWSKGVGDGSWCRRRVRSNLEDKPRVIRGLISSCEAALTHLEQRDGVQRAVDTLDSLRGLRSLLAALSFLRAELLEPGLHLKPAEWDAVLARARELSRTVGEHWPAGACEPVALKARDDVASRLGIALARLSKPDRTRDPRHAETLDEGIALLDQYVDPVYKWKPLPLPYPTKFGDEGLTRERSSPDEEDRDTWKEASWIVAACHEFHIGTPFIRASDLSRAKEHLKVRRCRRNKRFFEYEIKSVLAYGPFAGYAAAIQNALDSAWVGAGRRKPKRSSVRST